MQGNLAKIIPFPTKKPPKRPVRIDGPRYFTPKQIVLIRQAAEESSASGRKVDVRNWVIVDVLTSSGIRVAECANLRCGDLRAGFDESEIFVRCGKGCRSRTVQVPYSLRNHLKDFIAWKAENHEPVGEDDFLFQGQRGPLTPQGLQVIVKNLLWDLNLYRPGMSCHSLRHSYSFHYYGRSNDLRGLQKQLGHANVQTTTVYCDVPKEAIQENIQNLWEATDVQEKRCPDTSEVCRH